MKEFNVEDTILAIEALSYLLDLAIPNRGIQYAEKVENDLLNIVEKYGNIHNKKKFDIEFVDEEYKQYPWKLNKTYLTDNVDNLSIIISEIVYNQIDHTPEHIRVYLKMKWNF